VRTLSRREATEERRFLAILTACSLFAVGAAFVLSGGTYRPKRGRGPSATRRYSPRARRYAHDRIAPEPGLGAEPEYGQASAHQISARRHRGRGIGRESVGSVAARVSHRSSGFLRPTLRRPTPRTVRRIAVPALVGAVTVLVAVPIAWQLERTSDNVGALPDVPGETEAPPQPDTSVSVARTPEPVPLDSPSGETEQPSPAVAIAASSIDRDHDAPSTLSDPPHAPSAQALIPVDPPTETVPPPMYGPTVDLTAAATTNTVTPNAAAPDASLAGATDLSPPTPRSERHANRPPPASVHSALLSDIVAPAFASPVRVQIPRIGLDARVEPVGVAPDSRAVAVPPDGQTVAWYRHSAAPTQPGSAVLTAHVDYDGNRGAFFQLRLLQPGDTITIELDDGAREKFEVVARRSYARDRLPRQRIFGSGGPPVLTLVTCGGGFNETDRSYDSNVVVFAVPADPS
jgi:hypothetical protein